MTPKDERAWIAEVVGARTARPGARIQSLWGGYGELLRFELEGGAAPSVIVKRVEPPPPARRRETSVGDARKRRSYDVETTWYRSFAARCDETCRVPAFVGARVEEGRWLLVLEDLDVTGFPERRRRPGREILSPCLAWLAAFHARFLDVAPEGLWKTGTYWHLATRQEELAAIDDEALRRAAPILDRRLRDCVHRTLVHGDAKLANFCFDRPGTRVAAVDFQYVGGGCGMKDVAYLLCGETGDEAAERRHLDDYFHLLRTAIGPSANVDLDALEAEWRALYPIAAADFYRFLAGWSKESWRHDLWGQRLVAQVLRSLG